MASTPTLDKMQSFNTVLGEPGVHYWQSGAFFDAKGAFVRPHGKKAARPILSVKPSQPSQPSQPPQPPAVTDALARARLKISQAVAGPPKAVLQANAENRAAEAAENQAD